MAITMQAQPGPRLTRYQLSTIARLYRAGAHVSEIAAVLGITRQEAQAPYNTCKRLLPKIA